MRPGRSVAIRANFIVGDWYFFESSELLKTGTSLNGFYVNGHTGQVEFRETNAAIARDETSFDRGVYSRITTVSEAKSSGN